MDIWEKTLLSLMLMYRWCLIFSEAAYKRECRTLLKHYKKGSEKESKEFEKLSRKVFYCPEDAMRHLKRDVNKYKYLEVRDVRITEVKKYPSRKVYKFIFLTFC